MAGVVPCVVRRLEMDIEAVSIRRRLRTSTKKLKARRKSAPISALETSATTKFHSQRLLFSCKMTLRRPNVGINDPFAARNWRWFAGGQGRKLVLRLFPRRYRQNILFYCKPQKIRSQAGRQRYSLGWSVFRKVDILGGDFDRIYVLDVRFISEERHEPAGSLTVGS